MLLPLIRLFLLFSVSGAALAEPTFDQCIADWQDKARREGMSERVVNDVLAQLTHLPRVIELDRRQPEFTRTFGDYLQRRVTPARIAAGRLLLIEHRDLLQRLLREYGVPPRYLVAFWGLETNYGGYLGSTPVLDSLATLACDQRRSAYFTTELFHALELVERGVEPGQMTGSWAGAMGQTQFMPSTYRRFAVDGDGDGSIDLWDSVPDALSSAASFLKDLGWEPGLRWGREVRLPADFEYQLAGLKKRRSLNAWRDLGLRRADGGPLPGGEVEAALLLPAGHRGPAFLVYRNFDVIMGWNRSTFYALSVGHLADRIAGGGALHRPPPDQPPIAIETMAQLQRRLNELGFEAGEPDGILGPSTRAAVCRFQKARGMIADCHPGPAVLEALNLRE